MYIKFTENEFEDCDFVVREVKYPEIDVSKAPLHMSQTRIIEKKITAQ